MPPWIQVSTLGGGSRAFDQNWSPLGQGSSLAQGLPTFSQSLKPVEPQSLFQKPKPHGQNPPALEEHFGPRNALPDQRHLPPEEGALSPTLSPLSHSHWLSSNPDIFTPSTRSATEKRKPGSSVFRPNSKDWNLFRAAEKPLRG